MPELDDIALLAQFSRDNSEEAFATLAQRHINLVYSVALRKIGNPHAAEEITQAVFLILARKARGLSRGTVLPGWLHQTARLTAANYLRTELRRQKREQEAYMQSLLNEPESDAWTQIAPLLDDAISRLAAKDRDAIVLRFFEQKNLSEVGHAIGASEDAAKMRVNRALEKLRKFFLKRGVTLSTAMIAGAVVANSAQAAPLGLATTITTSVAKGSAVAVSTLSLVKGTIKIMTYAKLKLALGVAVATLLTAGALTVAVSREAAKDTNEDPIGTATAKEKTYSFALMLATKNEDYAAFIADGDRDFKKLPKSAFKSVCDQVKKRLQAGYHVVFLGGLKQQGYHLTIWKIAYDDGGNDDRLDLMVANDKVVGALLQ